MKLPLALVTMIVFAVALWVESAEAFTENPPCSYWGGRYGAHRNLVQWVPDGSRILFDHAMAVYAVNIDGTKLRQIVDGLPDRPHWVTRVGGLPGSGYVSMNPDLSPDNSRIVYSSCDFRRTLATNRLGTEKLERPQYEIVVSNLDGSEPVRLTDNPGIDQAPTWSPDGSHIAFVSSPYTDRETRLYTMAADGSDVRGIAPELEVALDAPLWSPDGRWIAFVAIREQEYLRDIFVVRPDGSDLTRISEALGGPSWSPDGEHIAFTKRLEDGSTGLHLAAADGSNLRLLTVMEDSEFHWDYSISWSPVWSPTGAEILVSCRTVCIVSATDGSLIGQAPIHLHGGDIPAWSPDGSRVAVLMGRQAEIPNGSIVLYTMASDGTDMRVLVRGGLSLSAENSDWRDTAQSIASCSGGFVVAEPEKNPGLVEDCRTLMQARDSIAGETLWLPFTGNLDGSRPDEVWDSVVLNWGPGTPIDQWTGVVTEDVCERGSLLTPEGCVAYVRRDVDFQGVEYGRVLKPRSPRVTGLELRHQLGSSHTAYFTPAVATIPSELGRLTHLSTLNLSGRAYGFDSHRFRGAIPEELGNLTNLRILDLSFNGLDGVIPAELGKLSKLRELRLNHNQLTGGIPVELRYLSELRELRLNRNQLTGGIPAELGYLAELRVLRLDVNQLTGAIPRELGSLSSLRELQLESNELSGAVPVELASIPTLTTLELTSNSLECVPAELKLRVWRVGICVADSYTFEIEEIAEVGQAVGDARLTDAGEASYSLTSGNEEGKFVIDADSGRISVAGKLDADETSAYTLGVEAAHGAGDRVSGSVTISVLSLVSLCSKGVIVPEPDANPGLVNDCAVLLALKENLGDQPDARLYWKLDHDIRSWNRVTVAGSPQRVQYLDLTSPGPVFYPMFAPYGPISGVLPTVLANLTGLRGLDLQGNDFTGEIPPELGDLPNLDSLWLSGNRLTGCIPPALLQVQNHDLGELGLQNCPGGAISVENLDDFWLAELD